jgi:hypothetical protein
MHHLRLLSHLIVGEVDLGPKYSVAERLATILRLFVLRREGFHITSWDL